MELFAGILFALLIGFLIGIRTQQRLQVDYKRRWKEAVALIDNDVEARVPLTKNPRPKPKLIQGRCPDCGIEHQPHLEGCSFANETERVAPMTRQAYGAIFVHDRADYELARMKSGLTPAIPPEGIYIHDVGEIMKAWAMNGWTWDGAGWTKT